MGEQQRKYFPLPPPPLAPAHSGTTSTVFILSRPRAPSLSAGKSDRGEEKEKESEIVSALSTYPTVLRRRGLGLLPREKGERERERGREGEGERGNNPLPSRGATGEETKKRRKEKLTGQYIFPPSVLPFVLTYTKRRIFTAQGQDKR